MDIIEFKNRLFTLSNCKEDTSKLLFILEAIRLDREQIGTKEKLKQYGYSTKKKIDFSEFFILA